MKKLTVFAALLLFVAFTSISNAQIQSGNWTTKVGDPGYNLDNNTGERSMTVEVNFTKPFEVKPKVILSVTQIDGDKAFNQRYNVEVLSVSRDGFTVKIRTWADSKIYGISGYWLAYSE
jgi:hypothetical protein